jgi:hypothetical protein
MRMPIGVATKTKLARWGSFAGLLVSSCGGGGGGQLNQTSITCPPGRTLLDGVCVAEAVADYVACVRAQGAQLGAAKNQQLSAEAGYLGVKAGGASELSESLQRKYSTSDQAMMAIVDACNSRAGLGGSSRTATASDQSCRTNPLGTYASCTGTCGCQPKKGAAIVGSSTVTNECGSVGSAEIRGTEVIGHDWRQTAKLSADGTKLSWPDGSTWIRSCP